MNSASAFIGSRVHVTSITDNRVKAILGYVCECYLLLLNDSPSYSKQYVKDHTSFHFEDYLKAELVDQYLIPNKQLIKEKLPALEEIMFSYETEKRFIDTDAKQKKDKIDIYINKLGLTNEWQTQDEHIYFVIECKRINGLTDSVAYVNDIQKFCDRNYLQLRLPFEGMIAFLEKKALSPTAIAVAVNQTLAANINVLTTEFLEPEDFHKSFSGSYRSTHQKNFSPNNKFKIYHLLLDYSSQIVN